MCVEGGRGGQAFRRKGKHISMKLLSRLESIPQSSYCSAVNALGFPLVHWQRYHQPQKNQEQNPSALHRDILVTTKQPTFSARASPSTSKSLDLSLHPGKRKLHSSKPQGPVEIPCVFPSTWLCGVSKTCSLARRRGRGLPKGQSPVRSKSPRQTLTRPEASRALPHRAETT